jgi:hypothetical protein
MSKSRRLRQLVPLFLVLVGGWSLIRLVDAQSPTQALVPGAPVKPATTPTKDSEAVLKGLEKIVSTSDGKPSLFTLHVDKKNAKVLAELPKDFEKKKYFIALTVAGGELFAGLQAGDIYVTWKRYGDRLALIEPDLETRSTGDAESKSSVQRLFTGKILADVPILAETPQQALVIDMVDLLLGHAQEFFGYRYRFRGAPGGMDPKAMRLREIKTAKAFPHNIELAFELPFRGGHLKTLHFSISEIPDHTGYQPREADDRVGYFTTAFDDLGKFKKGETRTRYINRWHLEKADPSLKMSPPKQPIVFYIEHTTPIRYRRFVRDGVLYWNKAFEQVGLVNAIEVYFQDERTGAHMEKDPEDVRYNFVRWLSNNVGTAIGPSRVHPLTGQILDADIILTDGWIRYFERQFGEMLPQLAMEGFGPDTLAWLERNPRWDPRFLLMPAHQRNQFIADLAKRGVQPLGGHPGGHVPGRMMGENEFDGLQGRVSQVNGLCLAAQGKAFDVALLRLSQDMLLAEEAKENPDQPKSKDDELDGVPSRFIGPLLADLVAHEVGHTLGLRHNFKASALYSMAEVNSKKLKGQKPFASSVMDYLPLNINMKDGEIQGDYAMIGVGPYDMWAIEYGYTFEKDLKPILAKCTLPENQYGTDQDTLGPDPLARRYDFSTNPLEYARNQMKLATYHRGRLLTKFVADGESWSKARHGYTLTLGLQMRSLSMMANWLGGAFAHRDHKGDKGNRAPLEPVPAGTQREALRWVVENTFRDEVYGLSPAILQRLRSDSLESDESFWGYQEATFPVHDRIMGMQSSVLTMLMSPTRLRRIYDNEALVEHDKDALTLPELMDTVIGVVFAELDKTPQPPFTVRKPMISSLRRNLQRELVDRLIDLAQPGGDETAATKPISNLAMLHLRQLKDKVEKALKTEPGTLDAYSRAHLQDAQIRITKALDAPYIFNARDLQPRYSFPFYFQSPPAQQCNIPGCSCQMRGWDTRKQE